MNTKTAETSAFEDLHPLRFTPLGRETFYLYRPPRGGWSWIGYDPDSPGGWPDDAHVGVNVLMIPCGADPGEVARWMGDNGDLIHRWCCGEFITEDVEDHLRNSVRVWHACGGMSTVEKDWNAWNNADRPGSFVRFLMQRRGATVEWCDFLGEYFVRWCERDFDRVRHIWVPLLTVGWMGRRRL